jgi:hypothetical protein
MVSLGVNEDGEEEMTVVGGDGGTEFSGGEAPIVSGSGSLQADLGKKTLSRLQAESSAAIHATAVWSVQNLAKTQAEQAERLRATMAAAQAAKALQDKFAQQLKDVTNAAIQKGRAGPSVTDLAHQTNMETAAFGEMVARNEAIKRAEKEARKAEEAYQAALRAEQEAQRRRLKLNGNCRKPGCRRQRQGQKLKLTELRLRKLKQRQGLKQRRRERLFLHKLVFRIHLFTHRI